MTIRLWPHQQRALDVSIDEGFASGVHAHATGTGKSVLGHALVRKYAEMHRGTLMIWLCEQASVVSEIFSRPNARNGLLVCDLVAKKPKDWWWCVQSALVWKRPVLIIVNRAFLVSQLRYQKLRTAKVGLVLHDECHSGTGTTTRVFYEWLASTHPTASVIGLSATPPSAKDSPHPQLAHVLSRYSVYDATCDGTIVPLRVCWCEGKERLSYTDSAHLSLQVAEAHNVHKIIVWCGTIEHCYAMAKLWHSVFVSWTVAVDTSSANNHGWQGYDVFCTTHNKALLFCAAKHREGSDIAGLGMGVFVDGVEKRGASVFVQCAGRVLRKSREGYPKKTCGVLLDLRAKDGMELCDRMGEFLQLPAGVMPWTFETHTLSGFEVPSLTLASTRQAVAPLHTKEYPTNRAALLPKFVRAVPQQEVYTSRLVHELDLMESKQLVPQLLRALDVLALAGTDVPHVTRGSCGSSLVCYLLGISHVDPVAHNICFARFLNAFRSSLPDIDFDFPHNRRSDIFLRMALKWPNQVARISNHVHFHEKSALRQALRNHGHKGNVPAHHLSSYVEQLPDEERNRIVADKNALEGEFRCFSLHCGGVVYYPEGIPQEARLEEKQGKLMVQVKLDKRDVSKEGHFKIDVLSSRALSQLMEGLGVSRAQAVHIDAPPFTSEMRAMLAAGDNIGVTLAESPLCRSELVRVQPTSVGEVAMCLALIRPASRESGGVIVYDDDAIRIIATEVGCTEAQADAYRRGMAKKDPETLRTLEKALGGPPRVAELQKKLGSMSQYGFCKAHAMSYAQLVTWLVWCKAHRPQAFWRGTLNHCHSSYKPWVHMWEAWKAGVDPFDPTLKKNDVSVYASCRKRSNARLDTMQQLRARWFWDVRGGFVEECYCEEKEDMKTFRGVIAAHRYVGKDKIALCVGYGDGYLDVLCNADGFNATKRMVSGTLAGGEPCAVCQLF